MRIPEKRQLVIVGAMCIIVMSFVGLRFYPLSRKTMRLRSAIAEQKSAAAQVDQYIALLPALKEQVRSLRTETGMFDTTIPGDRAFADLWQRIAEVMNTCRLTEQIVQPGKEVRGENITCIPIKIECSGSLKQIHDMLTLLKGFERIVRIEGLQLTNDAELSGKLKMNASASVYYQNSTRQNI